MWRCGFYIFAIYFVILLQCTTIAEDQVPWKWVCKGGSCLKTRNTPGTANEDPPLSLEACKMFCNEYGNLWPRPTGVVELGNYLSKVNMNNINVFIERSGASDVLVTRAGERFKNMMMMTVPSGVTPKGNGKKLDVYLENRQPDVKDFTLLLQEGYALMVSATANNTLNATITANTFFGLRHGLETLSQLFIYDEMRNHLLLVRDVMITDNPVYPYRGLLLDTGRNYYDIDSIKKTIDAMATVKLNTFHWHITDSQSFPFVSDRRPMLSKLGAFTPSKVYTKKAIQDIVQYGLMRGVRVMPEFDAPAHVGEGWQDSNLTVCFNEQPWSKYCVEPPCGQLNPARPELYDYLLDIYTDMAESFQSDIFHMGGDEVSEICWKKSPEIMEFIEKNHWNSKESSGIFKLWEYFQTKAQEKVYQAFKKKLPLILWTSTLTQSKHIDKYLTKDHYIIQVWTTGIDPEIMGLLKKGYNLIISNYDAWYLDCGFSSWVASGNNWCSPYIGWQKVYENSPAQMAGDYKEQILGGEVALWSEQADGGPLDMKLWPRAAAAAERLWAEPDASWRSAEQRLLNVRERLVRMGVQPDSIEPEWCYQNEGQCAQKNFTDVINIFCVLLVAGLAFTITCILFGLKFLYPSLLCKTPTCFRKPRGKMNVKRFLSQSNGAYSSLELDPEEADDDLH